MPFGGCQTEVIRIRIKRFLPDLESKDGRQRKTESRTTHLELISSFVLKCVCPVRGFPHVPTFCVCFFVAGILRIRPVLITVGATVLALFPLALHGGPLWEALCFAQIGGLVLATAVTLFIVPVFYSIFVLDRKFIRWEESVATASGVYGGGCCSGRDNGCGSIRIVNQ